jgi:hypothetical protein
MKCKDNSMTRKATYEELEARIEELERENQNLESAVMRSHLLTRRGDRYSPLYHPDRFSTHWGSTMVPLRWLPILQNASWPAGTKKGL